MAEVGQTDLGVVEYGLQTIHDRTLDRLNRGHHYDAFLDAYRRTRRARTSTSAVHVILGLPGESHDDMLATARELAGLEHPLGQASQPVCRAEHGSGRAGRRRTRSGSPSFDEYVGYVVDFLEELPGDCVIERLSGDAPPEYLVGPRGVSTRRRFGAAVEAEFRRRGTWQGYKAKGEG